MPDWNVPNNINIAPGGDNVEEGFTKTKNNFDDIYTKLNILKKLQASNTAPTNPAVNEFWFDTSTGVLKRYDGTQWVEVMSASNILSELLTVDGAGSGLDADLVRGLPADFSSSIGYQKLPSGVIVQWGEGVVVGNGTYNASSFVVFPISFPNAVYTVIATAITSGYIIAGVGSISLSGFDLYIAHNDSAGTLVQGVNYYAFWLAIGC